MIAADPFPVDVMENVQRLDPVLVTVIARTSVTTRTSVTFGFFTFCTVMPRNSDTFSTLTHFFGVNEFFFIVLKLLIYAWHLVLLVQIIKNVDLRLLVYFKKPHCPNFGSMFLSSDSTYIFRVRCGSDSSAPACCTAGPGSNLGSAPQRRPSTERKLWGRGGHPIFFSLFAIDGSITFSLLIDFD